jgi:hypothetical protein
MPRFEDQLRRTRKTRSTLGGIFSMPSAQFTKKKAPALQPGPSISLLREHAPPRQVLYQ